MSFWKEWATNSNAPVPFSDRAGQLIKIMREKTGAAEKRQGSQEITRAVQLLFLPVGKKKPRMHSAQGDTLKKYPLENRECILGK